MGKLMFLYILETIKYYLAYNICYENKVRRYWIPCIGFVGYSAFLLSGGLNDPRKNYVIMCVFVMTALAIAIKVSWLKKVTHTTVLSFFIGCMDESIGMLYKMANVGSSATEKAWHTEYFFQSISTVCILLVFVLIKQRTRSGKKLWNFMRDKVQYIVILVAVEMLLTIAGLSYLSSEIENLRGQRIIIILCAAAYVSLGLLVAFAIYVGKTNVKMEQLVKNQIFLKNMQEHYYETLLEKEQDTRDYRHDMRNHLICLEAMARDGKYEALYSYVQELQEKMVHIQNKVNATGNQIVDAITNYYCSFLDEDTNVQVKGTLDIEVDEMQLCTIYANLLQNAVEEVLRSKATVERFVEISVAQGQEFATICIYNSLSNEQQDEKNQDFFKTKKIDTKNHGLGLKNVKRALEEIGGRLELQKEEKQFIARAYIPVNLIH